MTDEYTERKYTLNCSPEAKKTIDNYIKKHNVTQKEVLDYMTELLTQSENKSSTSSQNDSSNEFKIVDDLIKSYSEKIIELLNRILMVSILIKGKDIDQVAIKNKAETSASEVCKDIYNKVINLYQNNTNRNSEDGDKLEKRNKRNSSFSKIEAELFGINDSEFESDDEPNDLPFD